MVAPPALIDCYALARSGHNIVMDWMGGARSFVNRENEPVQGTGIVVLREFTSWLASIMAVSPSRMRGHGFQDGLMVKRTPHDPDSVRTLEWLIDLWRGHAAAYEGDEVVPVSSYHWSTSSRYRNDLALELGCCTNQVNLGVVNRSSFDTGKKAEELLPLQRWRRMIGKPKWLLYRNLVLENQDCLDTSRRLFRVDFRDEIRHA